MVQTTRTLNPLPFQDLEPKRFEDLIRQLAYDFRPWRALEATGRAGSDDGFDARGWEALTNQDDIVPVVGEDEEIAILPLNDRKWLIQCKREVEIGPTKIARYLDYISEDERNELHGIIFAASCNFSKRSIDTFHDKCRALGVQESYLWGRGEIEDALFQPKNDGLLFAYFGISLSIRQRSLKTSIRSRLAMKRKVNRMLGEGDVCYELILLRDPEETNYPYIHDREPREKYKWEPAFFSGHHFNAIKIFLRKFPAYLDQDGEHWDMANAYSDHMQTWHNPWIFTEEAAKLESLRQKIGQFTATMPDGTFGHVEVTGILEYDDIIDIDEDGDSAFEHAHIYMKFDKFGPAFSGYLVELVVPSKMEDINGRYTEVREKRVLYHPEDAKQVEFFPREFTKPRRTLRQKR